MPTVSDGISPVLIHLKTQLRALRCMKLHIGIQSAPGKGQDGGAVPAATSDLLMIANVHEYGATITAKNAKNLAIPIHKMSYGKSPHDFEGLFFLTSEAGYLFGCTMKKGRKDRDKTNNINFLFLLLPSVTVPERSFIRAGYEAIKDRLAPAVRQAVSNIMHKGWTAQQVMEYVGGIAVGLLMEYMSTGSNFTPKGKLAQDAAPSWANNPLIVTGRLRNSLSFTVEGG